MKPKIIINVIFFASLLLYFGSNVCCGLKITKTFCNRTDRARSVANGGVGPLAFTGLQLTFTAGVIELTPDPLGPLMWTPHASTSRVWTYNGGLPLEAGECTPAIICSTVYGKLYVKKHVWLKDNQGKATCKTWAYINRPGKPPATDFHALFPKHREVISAGLVPDNHQGDANLEIKDWEGKNDKVEVTSFGKNVAAGDTIFLQVCYEGKTLPKAKLARFTYEGDETPQKVCPEVVYNPTNDPCDWVTFFGTLPIHEICPDLPFPFTTVSGLGTRTITFADPEIPLEPGEGVGEDGWVNFYTDDTTEADFYIISTTWCGESDIPTLTEWGLIIFGVVLLGFITWVFLKRRKAMVSVR